MLHLVEDDLSILQYVDDTVIFLDHGIQQPMNMKLLLCTFEQLSGLKINFHKSKIFCFARPRIVRCSTHIFFGCKIGTYPFRYLGLPMHYRKLNNKDWKVIEERIEKRSASWKGKMLFLGGRLVLINSVLSSILMFMLSLF